MSRAGRAFRRCPARSGGALRALRQTGWQNLRRIRRGPSVAGRGGSDESWLGRACAKIYPMTFGCQFMGGAQDRQIRRRPAAHAGGSGSPVFSQADPLGDGTQKNALKPVNPPPRRASFLCTARPGGAGQRRERRPVRRSVMLPGFHPGERGSTPLRAIWSVCTISLSSASCSKSPCFSDLRVVAWATCS